MNTQRSQIVDVLLVEDDPGDLTESGGTALRCHTTSDGPSAVRFLWRLDEFADAPRPRLILLDLNLGATHGLQILAKLKADKQLKPFPWSCCHRHDTRQTSTIATRTTPAPTSSSQWS